MVKQLDMEAKGIPEAHVAGIDLDYRAPNLTTEQRSKLPQPIMQKDHHWLELYWRAWAIAFDNVKSPEPETGFTTFCDAAFSENMFQWDTCFLVGFAKYASHVLPVSGSLDNFYRKQHDDGYICREISSVTGLDFWDKSNPSAINPPLFADAEWQLYQITKDKIRLKYVIQHLVDYFQWMKRQRTYNELPSYWTTSLASGMDNSPRTFFKGGDDANQSYNYHWVCLTAQQALAAKRIAQIYGAMGEIDLSNAFGEEYATVMEHLERHFWNADAGFYCDVEPGGSHSPVLTPAGMWAVLLDELPRDKLQSIESNLLDPNRFWRPHAIPSVSADHPSYHPAGNYWQGAVWSPMVLLTIRAMARQGRHVTAYKVAENHIENVYEVYRDTGTLWENYSSELPRRGNISRPEFVGWTGCGPIESLIENIIGIKPDASTDSITWNIVRGDKHGVENLMFKGHPVSLVYDPDFSTINCICEEEFTLKFGAGWHLEAVTIPKGKSNLKVSQ